MPNAPPDCTRNHSECRISTYNQRAVSVTAPPPVFDGDGTMLPPEGPPPPSGSTTDCVCETCGLMWTETTTYTPPQPMVGATAPAVEYSNVRQPRKT
jgi:hypothetical protein